MLAKIEMGLKIGLKDFLICVEVNWQAILMKNFTD